MAYFFVLLSELLLELMQSSAVLALDRVESLLDKSHSECELVN